MWLVWTVLGGALVYFWAMGNRPARIGIFLVFLPVCLVIMDRITGAFISPEEALICVPLLAWILSGIPSFIRKNRAFVTDEPFNLRLP